jgi:hypothetical protein
VLLGNTILVFRYRPVCEYCIVCDKAQVIAVVVIVTTAIVFDAASAAVFIRAAWR